MIGVYIKPEGMTVEAYHAVEEARKNAGISLAGMLVHTVFQEGNAIAIFDVWETAEAFQAFGQELGKLLSAAGVPPLEPMIVEMVDYQTA